MPRSLLCLTLALFATLCFAQSAISAPALAPPFFGVPAVAGIEANSPEAAKVFPLWWDVLTRHAADNSLSPQHAPMPEPVLKQWRALLEWYPSMDPAEKLRAVSGFFNSWPGKKDIELYGRQEYWATPAEFMRNGGGDCEDYAIAKYLTLRTLGWSARDMWIVLVHNTQCKSDHAVLAVRLDKTLFILDNLSRPKDLIMPHERYGRRYVPRFALNEEGVWVYRHKETAKKR